MKLKAIFALFNGVLLASFLLIFFMPLFLLGSDYFLQFWASKNWAIAAVFLITLGLLNAYFIMNWGLFKHLEREDWPALVSYLEERILGRGMVRPMYVRMILNAYLITSNTEGILALEAYLKSKKPRLIARYGLQFGIPYLLMKDPAVSEAFFASLLANARVSDRDWVRWNHAFSLLQQGRSEDVKSELAGLLESARDPVLRMLTLYLLDVFGQGDAQVGRRVTEGRERLTGELTTGEMNRRIEKSGENMEVVVLSKIVSDARDWLYSPRAGAAGLPAASGAGDPASAQAGADVGSAPTGSDAGPAPADDSGSPTGGGQPR